MWVEISEKKKKQVRISTHCFVKNPLKIVNLFSIDIKKNLDQHLKENRAPFLCMIWRWTGNLNAFFLRRSGTMFWIGSGQFLTVKRRRYHLSFFSFNFKVGVCGPPEVLHDGQGAKLSFNSCRSKAAVVQQLLVHWRLSSEKPIHYYYYFFKSWSCTHLLWYTILDYCM